jgi:phasin family protein
MTKYFEQFKVPAVDMDTFVAAQKKNVEVLTAANKILFEGARALSARQIEILRQGMEEAVANVQELSAAGAPDKAILKQAEIAKKSYEDAIANMRELSELASKSNTEAVELLNGRVAESFDEMKKTLETVTKK